MGTQFKKAKIVVKTSETAVEEVLKKSDFGTLVLHHKWSIIACAVAVIGILSGYAIYTHQSSSRLDHIATLVYDFSEGPLKNFEEDKDKKIELTTFLGEYENFKDKAGITKTSIPVVMSAASLVKERGDTNAAIEILKPWYDKFASDEYLRFVLGSALSAYEEDAGKFAEAKTHLEAVLKTSAKFGEPRIRFDIARLEVLLGEKEKAVAGFRYVMENFPNDEFARLARVKTETL
jgi:predicted negative regulator of RcsB-dependent stress response